MYIQLEYSKYDTDKLVFFSLKSTKNQYFNFTSEIHLLMFGYY